MLRHRTWMFSGLINIWWIFLLKSFVGSRKLILWSYYNITGFEERVVFAGFFVHIHAYICHWSQRETFWFLSKLIVYSVYFVKIRIFWSCPLSLRFGLAATGWIWLTVWSRRLWLAQFFGHHKKLFSPWLVWLKRMISTNLGLGKENTSMSIHL